MQYDETFLRMYTFTSNKNKSSACLKFDMSATFKKAWYG